MNEIPQPSRADGAMPFALVGVTACRRVYDVFPGHWTGERYLRAVSEGAGAIPVQIPALGGTVVSDAELHALLDRLDGLLLTGSPSNVEPHHYGGPPSRRGTLHDPERDATTLPLIREAVRRGLPLLAICRGIQELNVALGGTLHQRRLRDAGPLNHRVGAGR